MVKTPRILLKAQPLHLHFEDVNSETILQALLINKEGVILKDVTLALNVASGISITELKGGESWAQTVTKSKDKLEPNEKLTLGCRVKVVDSKIKEVKFKLETYFTYPNGEEVILNHDGELKISIGGKEVKSKPIPPLFSNTTQIMALLLVIIFGLLFFALVLTRRAC